jgi:uncharacterized OsmC-like protein
MTMQWETLCRNADRILFGQLMQRRQDKRGHMMSQVEVNTRINGVDVQRMAETLKAIQDNPALATFRFQAANRWITGGYNRSTIQSFHGAGQEDSARTRLFLVEADEPPVLLGQDYAPHPAEYVLHALAGCLTTSLVYHAAARGIRIQTVESHLEGSLDLRGFLGLSDTVRRGYQEVRAHFAVQADASAAELQALTKFSPVYDIVSNPVPVEITLETTSTISHDQRLHAAGKKEAP